MSTYHWHESLPAYDPSRESSAQEGEIYSILAALEEAGSPFNPKDIVYLDHVIVRYHSYAETEVFAVGQLITGKFFALEGGCDTTGWDCQASAFALVDKSKAVVISQGLTKEARKVLEIALPEDKLPAVGELKDLRNESTWL